MFLGTFKKDFYTEVSSQVSKLFSFVLVTLKVIQYYNITEFPQFVPERPFEGEETCIEDCSRLPVDKIWCVRISKLNMVSQITS